uniref:Uncharacterized protein n=1 Tax=Arundo donax TaxID=35708 RepID=A0A0A9GM86_ARUDO
MMILVLPGKQKAKACHQMIVSTMILFIQGKQKARNPCLEGL